LSDQPRNNRESGHFWADNEIVDSYLPQIGVYGFAVYMLLARRVNNITAQCNPGIPTMAAELNISKPTVRRALETLETVGLIEIKRHDKGNKRSGKPHTYTLIRVQKANTEESIRLSTGVNEVDSSESERVNAVDSRSQSGTHGGVNQVDPNNTKTQNKTQNTKESKKIANAAKPKKPKDPKPYQPIVDAWLDGLPENLRPIGEIKSWDRKSAKALLEAGATGELIGQFMCEEFPGYLEWATRVGAPKAMTLDHICKKFNGWKAGKIKPIQQEHTEDDYLRPPKIKQPTAADFLR
jgi:DNA-binding transcriptional regulator YhcF (GntR family)